MDGLAPGPALTKREINQSRRRTVLRTQGGGLVRLVILLSLLAAIIALAATGSLPWQAPYHGPLATDFPRNTLVVDFGLQRVSQTRSILVPTGNASASTPAILTARLSSDLVEHAKFHQFPANQITLTATPVGPSQVEIVAILNPVNPDKVADGLFTGSISVYTGSQTLFVPMAVYLAPKSGYQAMLAFLLLLLGAIFGLSVKWVTEALSSLAAARWRYDSIMQRLGRSLDELPTSAVDRLNDIRNSIARQDVSHLDGTFVSLESALGPLRKFSGDIKNINDDIARQEEYQRRRGNLPIKAVVHEERRQVNDLRNQEWPWPDADAMGRSVKLLSDQVRAATRAIEAGQANVVRLFAEGDFARAVEESGKLSALGADHLVADDHPADAAAQPSAGDGYGEPWIVEPAPRHLLPRGRWLSILGARGIIQWMTERPRSLAAAASILVVSIVGLQLQYLNSTSFDGSLADWLNLLLWAAVIELSGVSVLDVVGRLSGAGPAPRPGPR